MPSAVYQRRKEEGLCTRCGVPAADDSSLCAPHRDDQKGRVRAAVAKLRHRRRRSGLCLYCDTPVGRGEYSCLAHRVARDRLSGVKPSGVNNAVNKSERVAAATRKDADGRIRHHGQMKRGNQPHGQLNRQDVGFARVAMAAGEAGLDLCETVEVKAMPRIQREDVKRAALHQLERARGHIADVLERCGHTKQKHGARCSETGHVFVVGRLSCNCGAVAAPE